MPASLPPYSTPATGAFGALALAASRRVDLVMVSDSNGQYNGWGWSAGFRFALGNKYGIFASPLWPQENSGTYVSVDGNPIFSGFSGAGGATTGAPAAHAQYALPYCSYLYQATGGLGPNNGAIAKLNPTDANGVISNAFNIHSALTCWYSYGTFATGGGSFVPGVRMDAPPWGTLVVNSAVNTQTGVDGMAMTRVDLPAATRTTDLRFSWELPGGTAAIGKNTQFWQRIEDTNAQAGISVTGLVSASGQNLANFQNILKVYTQAQWTNFFKSVTYPQTQSGQEPVVVVLINSGDNDINNGITPSTGPLALTSDPTLWPHYLDNLRAVYNTITAGWVGAGLPTSSLSGGGLYFLVMPSQVYASTDNAKLIADRAACARFAAGKPNVSFVDIAALVPYAELTANGGYDVGVHLKAQAYQYIATKVVNTYVR